MSRREDDERSDEKVVKIIIACGVIAIVILLGLFARAVL